MRVRSCVRARHGDEEKAVGPDIPTRRRTSSKLALLQNQADLAGERLLFEHAPATREKTLGPEHPDTATSLYDLARLLKAQGGHARSQSLFERAQTFPESACRPEHPVYRNGPRQPCQNTLSRARATLQKRARSSSARWRSTRKALGPEYPDTATR